MTVFEHVTPIFFPEAEGGAEGGEDSLSPGAPGSEHTAGADEAGVPEHELDAGDVIAKNAKLDEPGKEAKSADDDDDDEED